MDVDGHVIQWAGDTTNLEFSMRDMIPSSGRFVHDDVMAVMPGQHRVTIQVAGTSPQFALWTRPAWR